MFKILLNIKLINIPVLKSNDREIEMKVGIISPFPTRKTETTPKM